MRGTKGGAKRGRMCSVPMASVGWEGWLTTLAENFKAYIRSLNGWGLIKFLVIFGILVFLAEVLLKGVGTLVKMVLIFVGFFLAFFVVLPWLHTTIGI